ncbi:rhodanese-like domain-containing protein [Candidatus Thioglobus sp.]|uniref:rhodanese-like domain-containing protein n=1 Tax=Candidatus Thioglobus sp. TaxID=2026721 RepID=UPI003D1462D4
MFQTNSLILLAFLVIALATLSGCTKPPYTNLDNEQLKAKLDQNIPLYDVRRPEEWLQTGVVKNSRLLTFADQSGRLKPDFIRKFTAAIGKHEAVMLICRTGNRTDSLARFLIEKLGYTQVYNVRRGIRGWIREGRPVVRP